MTSSSSPLFDRRAPASLVKSLADGGPFHGLVERVRNSKSSESLDLQLRANPNHRDEGSATLYVGLTKALDLRVNSSGNFCIDPQTRFGDGERPAEQGWTTWQPLDKLGPKSAAVMEWVESVIDNRPTAKVDHEGAVQAALTAAEGQSFCVIDREAMPAFRDQATKDEVRSELRQRMVDPVLARIGDPEKPWTRRTVSFGTKLDAIGLDDQGRVLIIEVKPGSETGPLGWTPLQVAVYLALFRMWSEADPDEALEVLQGMLDQRRQLGLLGSGEWSVRSPLELIPVVAVGRPVKNSRVADERMLVVHDAVSLVEPSLASALEVWLLSDVGDVAEVQIGHLEGPAATSQREV